MRNRAERDKMNALTTLEKLSHDLLKAKQEKKALIKKIEQMNMHPKDYYLWNCLKLSNGFCCGC